VALSRAKACRICRWAVRAVLVAGLGFDGSRMEAERWASCWHHLPAAIHMASHWFDADGRGQVGLEHVAGGSCERPGWLHNVDFFEPWYVAPNAVELAQRVTVDEAVVAVSSEAPDERAYIALSRAERAW